MPHLIDWKRCALNIRGSGLSLKTAGELLGKHKDWLGELCNHGTEPRFSDGMRLLDLHVARCGEAKTMELMR
jgi:hypothetical protein